MIAKTLVSNEIIPLRTSDTGNEALSIMNEFGVRHLPIVNDKQLLGLISEDDILDFDVEEAVGSFRLSTFRPHVNENDHLYEVIKVLSQQKLTMMPVINDDEEYVGLISQEDLIHYFAKIGSFTESGSIVVLEVNRRDYSLVEIARIVESEGAAILSSFVTSHLDSLKIDVTLKINRPDLMNIIATFDRFDYTIKATFSEEQFSNTIKERYDMLMTYLNV
ncbi:MAG: CBS domain-containing protein [Bacteroidota bacterium]